MIAGAPLTPGGGPTRSPCVWYSATGIQSGEETLIGPRFASPTTLIPSSVGSSGYTPNLPGLISIEVVQARSLDGRELLSLAGDWHQSTEGIFHAFLKSERASRCLQVLR